MEIKNKFYIFLMFVVATLHSQNREHVVFQDTLVFRFDLKDFVPVKRADGNKVFFRKEEKNNKYLTNFFQLNKIKKLKSEHRLLDLNEFLYRKEFYNYENRSFKYGNIQKRFSENVIIFVDTTCIGKKFYSVKTMVIVQ